MNIKNLLLIITCVLISFTRCNDLDLPPMNIIQDKDVFKVESGVTAYMMRLYYDLPIEDFRKCLSF